MHRDVSAANILIVDPVKGLGILNDWDLCKYDVELQGGATQDDRSVSVLSPGCLLVLTK